jgi:hypothetical protein
LRGKLVTKAFRETLSDCQAKRPTLHTSESSSWSCRLPPAAYRLPSASSRVDDLHQLTMLGQMPWLPNWKANDTASADTAAAAALANRNLPPTHTRKEGPGSDVNNESVDALLTQFPAYGSRQPQDWMLLGYPAATANAVTEEMDDLPPPVAEMAAARSQATTPSSQQRSPNAATAAAHASGTAPTVSNKYPLLEDWDATEQNLWKNSSAKSIQTALPPMPSTENKDTTNVKPVPATSTIQNSAVASPWSTDPSSSRHTMSVMEEGATPKALAPHRSSLVYQSAAEDRQHWMPDQYCKQCYACEAPFNVFRRRHHCRLCGQVFCNPCSAYFVPQHPTAEAGAAVSPVAATATTVAPIATTPSSGSTIRVCQHCHTQVQQQQLHQLQQLQLQQSSPSFTRKTPIASENRPTSPALTQSPRPQVSPQSAIKSATPAVSVSPPSATQDALSDLSHPTPKTQNVIDEAMLQQQQQQTSKATPTSETLDAMWQTLSQKSLLFLPDLSGASRASASAAGTSTIPEEEDDAEDDKETTVAESDAGTTVTGTTAASNRPSWFPLQRGTSMGTAVTANSNQTNAQNTIPPANPSPPEQTEAVAEAEAAVQSEAAKDGRRQLGLAAASHLESLARNLLEEYAPRLLENMPERDRERWTNNLLTLATRCCATVEPNVKNGDLIDVRPYCKIKVISGGHYDDCAYLSGVVFRKMVSHKRMAKELMNPRIMLLSGGIEFTRHENQIASFEALFEQEQKYMEILVGKILKLQPDILMVGRFVSRKAHELLLDAGVVLIQHVKATLLSRIARQTGATIISSTDHIMNQVRFP